ncbi:hypothetical protein ACFY9U_30325 [Streptomyces anthocyanicus]|uniref:hypothetical protein n=1 Tax=Streptomyces TaxID=1883 RepID=UPI0029B0992A|nr:hypothetical protein [Streptomyces sp. ME02-6985-2c]MDX3422670.1 hypothetical protein [Streptomyces sp. ME02-6985-2c]
MTRQPLRADTPRHAPSSPYAALPANAPGTPSRRTRLSPPMLRVSLLAVRGCGPLSLRVPLLAVRG